MATATRKEAILGKLLWPARVSNGLGPIQRAYEEAKQPKAKAELAGPIRYVLSDGWKLAAVHTASLFDGFLTESWVEGPDNELRKYRIIQNGEHGIVVTRGPIKASVKNWVDANVGWSWTGDCLIQVSEEDYDRWVASKGRLTLTTGLPAFFRLPRPGKRVPSLDTTTVFTEVLAAKQEQPKVQAKQPEDAFAAWMKEWIAKTKAKQETKLDDMIKLVEGSWDAGYDDHTKHLEAHQKLAKAESRRLFKHGDERKSAITGGWERYNGDLMTWEHVSTPRKTKKKARKDR